MKNYIKEEKGFTLIEVILSIAILSIVSVIVLRLFVLSNTINEDSKMADLASIQVVNHLENIKKCDSLTALINQEPWLIAQDHQVSGSLWFDNTFTQTKSEVSYALTSTLLEDSTLPGLYHITVQVVDQLHNESLATYTTNHYFKLKE